ncbi:MAG: spore coat associated protein CotJA [Ruminococcaceae bacterium]|nr:spore coat associated protein CotJA [Oscillospiraceae bacterium]
MPTFLDKDKKKRPALPKDASVTMAYIPLQETLESYSADKALEEGTLFPELNKPFKGRMVKK